MAAPRPSLRHFKRSIGEAFETDAGLVVIVFEEESLLARVVGARAEGSGLPAPVVPHQVAVPGRERGLGAGNPGTVPFRILIFNFGISIC